MKCDQTALRTLLVRRDHPDVKILPDGRRVSANEAYLMTKRALQAFEWGGNARRVRWIRPPALSSRAALPWRHCYRTTAAVTLSPSIEWLRSLRRSYAAEVNA